MVTDKVPEWKCCHFKELTLNELYSIIDLRIRVFVTGQSCLYRDTDYKDQQSHHLMGIAGGEIIAYARIIPPNISYEGEASIGRVAADERFRGKGIGISLMKKAIAECRGLHGNVPIHIGAQTYLLDFYSRLGFTPIGEPYFEDRIEHIGMRLTHSLRSQ